MVGFSVWVLVIHMLAVPVGLEYGQTRGLSKFLVQWSPTFWLYFALMTSYRPNLWKHANEPRRLIEIIGSFWGCLSYYVSYGFKIPWPWLTGWDHNRHFPPLEGMWNKCQLNHEDINEKGKWVLEAPRRASYMSTSASTYKTTKPYIKNNFYSLNTRSYLHVHVHSLNTSIEPIRILVQRGYFISNHPTHTCNHHHMCREV